jgi:hypothetical protein
MREARMGEKRALFDEVTNREHCIPRRADFIIPHDNPLTESRNYVARISPLVRHIDLVTRGFLASLVYEAREGCRGFSRASGTRMDAHAAQSAASPQKGVRLFTSGRLSEFVVHERSGDGERERERERERIEGPFCCLETSLLLNGAL